MKWTSGDTVLLNITNSLTEATTVHFHGAHVPPSMDGGPQNAFAAGEDLVATFTVKDEAKTLWYHPHALGTTAEQATHQPRGHDHRRRGRLGRVRGPAQHLRHRRHPDHPAVSGHGQRGRHQVQPERLPGNGLSFPLLCNGTNVDDTTLSFTATKKRTRFRLLNASPSDIITIQRSDGATLTQIATDQGYLPEATEVASIRLVAGAQAEFVMELSDAVTLEAVVTTGWVRGGSGTYEFLSVTPDASDAPETLPILNTISRYDTSDFTARTITLGQSSTTMTINGSAGTSMSSMAMISTTLGAGEVWTVRNERAA